MRRNFILPSDTIKYVQHDCRPEKLKFKSRSILYDVSVLTTVISKTKKSLNSILYENYLTQPENIATDSKYNVDSSPGNPTLNDDSLLNTSFLCNKEEAVVEEKMFCFLF